MLPMNLHFRTHAAAMHTVTPTPPPSRRTSTHCWKQRGNLVASLRQRSTAGGGACHTQTMDQTCCRWHVCSACQLHVGNSLRSQLQQWWWHHAACTQLALVLQTQTRSCKDFCSYSHQRCACSSPPSALRAAHACRQYVGCLHMRMRMLLLTESPKHTKLMFLISTDLTRKHCLQVVAVTAYAQAA